MRPSEIWEIGPDLAAKMLEQNQHNRNISERKVKEYARDMKEGRWMENSSSIAIDPNGNLFNGQHRLWAIIESGKTFRFHVITEHLPREMVWGTLDINMGRTLKQKLAMAFMDKGVKYDPNLIGGMARLVWFYDNCPLDINWTSGPKYTATMMEDFSISICDNDYTALAAATSPAVGSIFRAGKTWWAGAIYVIARDTKYPELVEEFINGVIQGAGLDLGDPRLTFRNYLSRNEAPHTLRDQRAIFGITLKAWNKFVRREKSTVLAFRVDENLPKPV